MRLADRVHSLARQKNKPALIMGAYRALAATLFFLGDFASARRNAMRGVKIWRSGKAEHLVEEITAPAVACLYSEARPSGTLERTFLAMQRWQKRSR